MKPIEQNLPIPPTPLPTPLMLTPNTPASDVVQSDMDLVNAAGLYLYQQWSRANFSIKELTSLFKMTVDFTKHRRKLLDMPYGAQESAKTRKSIVYPVD